MQFGKELSFGGDAQLPPYQKSKINNKIKNITVEFYSVQYGLAFPQLILQPLDKSQFDVSPCIPGHVYDKAPLPPLG
jgi:hypothetical protein